MLSIISSRRQRATLILSIALHAVVFCVIYFVTNDKHNSLAGSHPGSVVSIDELTGFTGSSAAAPAQQSAEQVQSSTPPAAASQGQTGGGNIFGGTDTAGLPGVYSEQTLGVHVRYPSNWTFIDQNKKHKLDGVTFIGNPTTNGQIPYIHIKVLDKYLFNQLRYKYSLDAKKFKMFYNDPDILESQYSQEVYIRTETEEDYSIKLIVRTQDAFKEFQPVFLAMVQSFTFGR